MRMSSAMQRDRGLGVAALVGVDEALEQLALGLAELAGAVQSSRRPAGRCSRSVARARCSALLTAATPISSSSATSRADQSSTSRRISTARWRGGRSWMTARNVSSIVSRADHGRVRLLARRRDLGLLEQPVGIGLQPREVAEGAERRHAPPVALDRVEAGVRRDLVQPRAEPVVALERGAAAPRAQERLLHEVLGLLEGAEHPVAVDVQLAAVALGQRGELGFGVRHGGHHRRV